MDAKEQIEQMILQIAQSVRKMPESSDYQTVKAVYMTHFIQNIRDVTEAMVVSTFQEMLDSDLVDGRLLAEDPKIGITSITELGLRRLSELDRKPT